MSVRCPSDARQMPVRFLESPGGADLDKSRNSLSYPMETKGRIYWKTKSRMAPLYLSHPPPFFGADWASPPPFLSPRLNAKMSRVE